MSNKKRYQKVFVNDDCIIDFTEQTITAEDVRAGKSFFNRQGNLEQGNLEQETVIIPDTTATSAFEGSTALFAELFSGSKNGSIGNAAIQTEYLTINVPEGVTHFNGSGLEYLLGNVNYKLKLPSTLQALSSQIWSGPAASSGLAKHIYINDINIYINQCLNSGISCPRFYNLQGELITNFIIPEGVKTLSFESIIDPFNYSEASSPGGGSGLAYTTLTVPSTITSLQSEAFTGAGLSLSTLIIKASTPPAFNSSSSSLFYQVGPADLSIIIPAGTKQAYLSATGWADLDYYLIEDDTPVTFTVKGNTFTIPKTMSWKDFVESEYNNGSFSIGNKAVSSNDRIVPVYEICYNGSTIYTSANDEYYDCPITDVAYIKPTIYD
jgi:hypothetical protein